MAKLNLLSPHSPFLRLLLIIAFFLAASLIPFIGLLFLITLPLALFVLCLLNDQMKVLVAFLIILCAMVILLSFMHTVLPVFALATTGLAGILMAQTARKNYSIEIVLLLPAFVILGAIVFYFVYGGMQLSMSPWQLLEKHITEAVESNIQLYSRLPLNPEEINAIKNSKPTVIQFFTKISPALCIISILFMIWINALMGNKLLHKRGVVLPKLSALSEWRAPNWLVWIFIAGGGLSFLSQTHISFLGINIFLVASFVYLLQGLAIVSFFFQSKDISIFFRCLFYFLIAIQQIVMIAIAAVGFFDIWIDFRKYFRKDQATN
ncbi:MAG: DUF2232 domain-containing protein [Smithellaceae bacterium]|nr:DUF2232 domain-containing protein [Smithellaceae bacterium]